MTTENQTGALGSFPSTPSKAQPSFSQQKPLDMVQALEHVHQLALIQSEWVKTTVIPDAEKVLKEVSKKLEREKELIGKERDLATREAELSEGIGKLNADKAEWEKNQKEAEDRQKQQREQEQDERNKRRLDEIMNEEKLIAPRGFRDRENAEHILEIESDQSNAAYELLGLLRGLAVAEKLKEKQLFISNIIPLQGVLKKFEHPSDVDNRFKERLSGEFNDWHLKIFIPEKGEAVDTTIHLAPDGVKEVSTINKWGILDENNNTVKMAEVS